jgi:hypothetical protein
MFNTQAMHAKQTNANRKFLLCTILEICLTLTSWRHLTTKQTHANRKFLLWTLLEICLTLKPCRLLTAKQTHANWNFLLCTILEICDTKNASRSGKFLKKVKTLDQKIKWIFNFLQYSTLYKTPSLVLWSPARKWNVTFEI